jgi:hypothetical protein
MLDLTKNEIQKILEESAAEKLGKDGQGFSEEYLYMVNRGLREVSRALAPIISRVTGRYSVMDLLYPINGKKASNE